MSSFLWYGVRQIRGNILYFSCIFDFNICVCCTWLYAVGCTCFSLCISVHDCMLLGAPVSAFVSLYMVVYCWVHLFHSLCISVHDCMLLGAPFSVCVSLYMIVYCWVHLFHSLCTSVHDCMLFHSLCICTWLYGFGCTCFTVCVSLYMIVCCCVHLFQSVYPCTWLHAVG